MLNRIAEAATPAFAARYFILWTIFHSIMVLFHFMPPTMPLLRRNLQSCIAQSILLDRSVEAERPLQKLN